LFTYLSPLVMVMLLTLGKEAYDDFKRYKRDKSFNSALYKYGMRDRRCIRGNAVKMVDAWRIRVGDVLEISAKERIPADMVILSTSEPTGSIFIKTDQLDGETDWKVRRAIRSTHPLLSQNKFAAISGEITYAPACDDIYDFLGSYKSEQGKK
jgi:phospholipid-translocating ATPase